MMQILPLVLKGKLCLFEEYGTFFQDYNQDKTTFAIKLQDISLPDYASKKDNIRDLKNTKFANNIIDKR